MNINKKLVEKSDLYRMMHTYFDNFEIKDPQTQSLIKSRYEVLVSEQSLWALELWENAQFIGSAVVCERGMTYMSIPFNVCFFSQIWIEPKNRGKGYLNFLMRELDTIASKLNSEASIVISRKAVGNLYTRYGFQGFSKFPSVNILHNEKSSLAYSIEENISIDSKKIKNAFDSTYGTQDFNFQRSSNYWNAVLSDAFRDILQIHTHEIDGTFFYYLVQFGEVIELASQKNDRWVQIVDYLINSGLKTIKISEVHPAHKPLLARNAVYSTRPEPNEGHMMKIYKNASQSKLNRERLIKLREFIIEMKLEVLPLDQW